MTSPARSKYICEKSQKVSNQQLYSRPPVLKLLHEEKTKRFALNQLLAILSCLTPKWESRFLDSSESEPAFEPPQFEPAIPLVSNEISTEELMTVTSDWSRKSKKLIHFLNMFCLEEKKKSTFFSCTGMIFPVISLIKTFDSVFGEKVSNCVLNEAQKISPYLGSVLKYCCKYVPHCCVVFLLGDRMHSWYKARKLLKASKENEELFGELKSLILETDVFGEEMRNALFEENVEVIVSQAEEILQDYRSSMLTFSALCLIASVAPSTLSNADILYKLSEISKTEAIKVFFKRISSYGIENEEFNTEEIRSSAKPTSSTVDGILGLSLFVESVITVQDLFPDNGRLFPLVTLAAINCFSFYCSLRKYKNGSDDHNYITFKKLFANTSSHVRNVNDFMHRYSVGM